MSILQMAFGENASINGNLKSLDNEINVVYTGTHDNDTTIGWFQTLPGSVISTQTAADIVKERKRALKFLGTDGSEINWDLISLALHSKANTVIIPLQDILGLGTNARMNTPGTIEGNWQWRFKKNTLTSDIIERMRTLTEESKRL
jgi:4-alpha-glucanotransferase